ncbi:cysteine dioxygenase family protein [Dyella sp. C11]|uniref:cysteine dioxygenase n=1 Tax=Dyella sp. C11 TaxID=2126991 RepID=UPI000D6511B5|nr:cysteine dioxygenase family protein [Dyella sp. C11]
MHDALAASFEAWGQRVLSVISRCINAQDEADVSVVGRALSAASSWEGCPRASELSVDGAVPAYRRISLGEPGAFEALLILWPPGHATPIHDHQGLWGLEYVLDGVLEVESFKLTPSPDIHLEPQQTLVAGVGDYLVFSDADYAHRCRNFSKNRAALTLHVYGGSLDAYRSFHATEDAWSWMQHETVREKASS